MLRENKLPKLNIIFDLDNTLIYSVDKNNVVFPEDDKKLRDLVKEGLAGEISFTERFKNIKVSSQSSVVTILQPENPEDEYTYRAF